MIDSTHVKAHRSAAGGEANRLLAARAGGATRRSRHSQMLKGKGRLIAILLTGGDVHACPVAERLICRVGAPECMLAI